LSTGRGGNQPEELKSRAAYRDWLANPSRQEVQWRDLICCWRGAVFVRPSWRCRWPQGWVLARCWAICWPGSPLALGLGFISDVDEILHFSELGVVFLMFIIGLELNPSKLWRLRSSIFGVGRRR
jgi:hypothetical protein